MKNVVTALVVASLATIAMPATAHTDRITPPAGATSKEQIDWFRPVAEAPRSLSELEAVHPGVKDLVGQLKMLGVPASTKIGAFQEKAMAIEGLPERIAFLNRGQGWVVKKLREMLPKVRDDGLHRDLSEMLTSHETNIARTNEALKA